MKFLCLVAITTFALVGATAFAAPATYNIDPTHTFPSFAADHMGISVWRGKFNHTTGTVTIDREARTGQVHIIVDMSSVDFGLDSLNKVARGPKLFDVAKYPHAIYDGKLAGFSDGKPTRVEGKLTLHGVTRPVTLKLLSFKCILAPLLKPRKRCGAEAVTTLHRERFGMDFGKDYGFKMTVQLHIQVEAIEAAAGSPAAP